MVRKFSALFAGFVVQILLVSLMSCQSVGPTGRPIERTEPEKTAQEMFEQETGPSSARKLIGIFGGEISFRHLKLTIPSGAVSEDVYVEVRLAENAPEGFIRETAYLISPKNFVFNKPALLRLHYFDDDLEAGQVEDDIVLVKESQGMWFQVGGFSLDVFNNIVSARIEQTGIYALKVVPKQTPLINMPPEAVLEYEVTTLQSKEKAESSPTVSEAEVEKGGETKVGEKSEIPSETKSFQTEAENEKVKAENKSENRAGAPSDDTVSASDVSQTEKEGAVETVESEQIGRQEEAVQAPSRQEDALKSLAEEGAEVVMPEGSRKDFRITKREETEPREQKFEGYLVKFSAEKSKDVDGTITRYLWDFDCDGIFDQAGGRAKLERTYFEYGRAVAILKVEDDQRPAGWDVDAAAIELPKPDRNWELPLKITATLFPKEVPVGGKLLACVYIQGGEPPYDISWQFSNGESSDKQILFVSPTKAGTFVAKVSVTDAKGTNTAKDVSAKVVAPRKYELAPFSIRVVPSVVEISTPSVVDFEIRRKGGTEPIFVQAQAMSTEETVRTDTLAFSFNFANSGYDFLTIIATDARGQVAKSFVPVRIGPKEEETLFEPAAGRADFQLKLKDDGMSIELKSTNVPEGARVEWEFGDGTSAEGNEVVKRFAQAGVYRVRMEVDDGFSVNAVERVVPVGGGELSAAIDLPEKIIGVPPFVIYPKAVVTGGKFPLFYRWNMKDFFSDEQRPKFVITEPGSYQLQLTVSDAEGNYFDAYPVQIEVLPPPPDYRYPIAFAELEPTYADSTEKPDSYQSIEQQIADKLNAQNQSPKKVSLIEFDGSSTYTLPFMAQSDVLELSAGGVRVALGEGSGFSVYELSSLRKLISFEPSTGKVLKVFLTTSQDVVFFNLLQPNGEVQGFAYSLDGQAYPVGEMGERILSVNEDGTAVLLANSHDEARLVSFDPLSFIIRDEKEIPELVSEGVIVNGGNSIFILTPSSELMILDASTLERTVVAEGGNNKSNLKVSADGRVYAYNADGDSIVVGIALTENDEFPPWPINLSEYLPFYSDNFQISPDGMLLVAYGSFGGNIGLFSIAINFSAWQENPENIRINYITEGGLPFTLSSSLNPFDILTPEEMG